VKPNSRKTRFNITKIKREQRTPQERRGMFDESIFEQKKNEESHEK
jgi:hypothetical protein